MAHESEHISLDAGMWLDDLSSSASTTNAANNALLPTTSFVDADADVHALFPMLSETTFDYDGRKSSHDVKTAFPDDLSPILTSTPALKVDPSSATLHPRRKSSNTKDAASAANVGGVIPFPHHDVASAKGLMAPTGTRRRRRLRSTSLLAALTQWTEHEQNIFFLTFKLKWSIEAPTPEQFAMLLLERFDAVSEKLKNTQKTSHDVEAFYTTMLRTITELLDTVAPHDIDLLNADEIRIALRCWHKLLTDRQKRQEIETIEDGTDEQKKPLAHELLQSIVRSRRQMLKSKATNHSTVSADSLLPAGFDEAKEMESLEGLLREALEHSSLPSYLYQLAPVEANTVPVVHHPVVRRKSATQSSNASTPKAGQKRQRSESVELYQSFTNGTPLRSVAGASVNTQPSFVTPPIGNPSKKMKNSSQSQTPQQSSRKKIYIKLRMVPRDTQTRDLVERCGCNPKVELKLSSSKKVSDVLDHMTKKWASVQQLVDAQASLHFFQKDSSTTSPQLPACASQPSQDQVGKSWSQCNHNVTCLDIWKHSGKTKNDEYIAEVSYQWCVDETADRRMSLSSWPEDPSNLLDLLNTDMTQTKKYLNFDQDDCSSKENSPFASPLVLHDLPTHEGSESETTQIQSLKKQSLQAFSETVAFDTRPFGTNGEEGNDEQLSLVSLPEDALSELLEFSPNSQSMRRRRIKPVLVSTDECQI